jgi:hypothetical protein
MTSRERWSFAVTFALFVLLGAASEDAFRLGDPARYVAEISTLSMIAALAVFTYLDLDEDA